MANDAMRHHWTDVNGAAWVEHQRLYDRMLGPITEMLLGRIIVEHGQRILDVGCGTGTSGRARRPRRGDPSVRTSRRR